MRGERLPETPVVTGGIPGDRRWAFARDGRLVTARQDPGLVARPASSRDELPYELVEDPAGLFDVAPLHLVNLASVAWLARVAHREVDHRRFRANVYLDGPLADEERHWPGRLLRLGSALVRVTERCERCVISTLHPDTGEAAAELLRVLTAARGATFGVYCEVIEPGYVAAGDACELV